MSDLYSPRSSGHGGVIPTVGITRADDDQDARARRAVASLARDADDARALMVMLGLLDSTPEPRCGMCRNLMYRDNQPAPSVDAVRWAAKDLCISCARAVSRKRAE